MKILGLDYGTKRIGVAISDETQTLARPLMIMNNSEFDDQLRQLMTEESITIIVVGLPLNMSGQDSEKTQEAREFATRVEQVSKLPVKLVDERLSTIMAEQITDHERVDDVAAQFILQQYLNQQKHV